LLAALNYLEPKSGDPRGRERINRLRRERSIDKIANGANAIGNTWRHCWRAA